MRNRESSRVHVVMVSGNAPPVMDGVGDCTARLITELARQRPEWRWTWQVRRPGWRRCPLVIRDGYRLIRPNHTWTERGRRVACATIKALKPDLVHIQEQIHSFFETDAAPRLAAASGCPVITTLHEYHIELASVVHTDALVRASTALIANDTRNAERCRERTGRDVDARWWSGSSVLPRPRVPDPNAITTFGFISGLKAMEPPLAAIAELRRSTGRPWHWRIIGPFTPETDRDHASLKELAQGGWVEFTGGFSVCDPELADLLARSRIMLLPYADGASLRRSTLHAAWAFGIPVITTPPPHDEPAIVDGENCLLVSDQTPAAWAEAIARIVDSPALEAKLAAGSLQTAQTFGWPELARRHLALYDRILAQAAEGATA